MTIPRDTPWLTDPDARALCDALGGEVYFVGGCVRNALLDEPVSDVDLATPLRPEKVTTLAELAGLQVVPTGIDHGTVTVVSGGKGFEVTTFRRDVATDGRRAVIAFADDIAQDARRRDFTMNALYAAPDGVLVDPLGGLPDLLARRVRFIENADSRIREDYLRILRYFRFHAWYGSDDEGFDAEALAAIAQNLDGLAGLSAERIGAEMTKLLRAPDPGFAVAGMRQSGVLASILPGSDDRFLAPLIDAEQQVAAPVDWRRRLVVLGGEDVARRLRLSKADARFCDLLSTVAYGPMPLPEVAYRHGFEIARDALLIRNIMANQVSNRAGLPLLESASVQKFPIRAADLQPRFSGKALGDTLDRLEREWIASGFELDRDALLRRL